MSFQPGAMLYTQSFGSRPENVEVPHIDVRAPGATDVLYPIGKRWLNTVAGAEYVLTGLVSFNGATNASWAFLGAADGDLNTITTDDSTIVIPSSGNINLAGASPLSTTGSGSTATINLSGIVPVANGGTGAATLTGVLTGNGTSAVTANTVTQHGVLLGGASNGVSSLAVASTGTVLAGVTGLDPAFTDSPSVSGSMTAGTTITATLGAITATNGNVVLGTAGNKIISTSVASTTTAGANSFGTVTLVGGTATIATTAITASSIVILSRQSIGSTGAAALGILTVGTITASTSFVINAVLTATASSLATTDVSVIAWQIIN